MQTLPDVISEPGGRMSWDMSVLWWGVFTCASPPNDAWVRTHNSASLSIPVAYSELNSIAFAGVIAKFPRPACLFLGHHYSARIIPCQGPCFLTWGAVEGR